MSIRRAESSQERHTVYSHRRASTSPAVRPDVQLVFRISGMLLHDMMSVVLRNDDQRFATDERCALEVHVLCSTCRVGTAQQARAVELSSTPFVATYFCAPSRYQLDSSVNRVLLLECVIYDSIERRAPHLTHGL